MNGRVCRARLACAHMYTCSFDYLAGVYTYMYVYERSVGMRFCLHFLRERRKLGLRSVSSFVKE